MIKLASRILFRLVKHFLLHAKFVEGPERTRRWLEDEPTLKLLFAALVVFTLVGQITFTIYVWRQQRIIIALGQTVVLQTHFCGQPCDIYVVACITRIENTQVVSTVELRLSLEGGSEASHCELFELVPILIKQRYF